LPNGTCAICPKGTFDSLGQSLGVRETCEPCPLGHSCPDEGMTAPAPCAPGSFQDDVQRGSCRACPANAYCELGAATYSVCPQGSFLNTVTLQELIERGMSSASELEQACEACIPAMICDSAGVALQTLQLAPGFYRESPMSTNVFECPTKGACSGGNSTGDGSCSDGHTGFTCAVCEDGYLPKRTTRLTCHECESREGDLTVAGLCLIGLIGLIAAGLCMCQRTNPPDPRKWKELGAHPTPPTPEEMKTGSVSGEAEEGSEGQGNGASRTVAGMIRGPAGPEAPPPTAEDKKTAFQRRRCRRAFRTICHFLQLALIGVMDYGIGIPPDALDFLLFFRIVNLEVLPFVTSCLDSRADLVDQLVFYLAVPVTACLVFIPLRSCVVRIRDACEYGLLLVLSFTVVPAVAAAGRVFRCDDFGEDGSFLHADYSIECGSSWHKVGIKLAVVILFLYVVVLVFFAGLLHGWWLRRWNVEFLVEGNDAYRLSAYFEPYEYLGRFAVAIAFVWWDADFESQLIGFTILACFGAVLAYARPFLDWQMNFLALTTQLALALLFLYGMLGSNGDDDAVTGYWFIGILGGIIATAILLLLTPLSWQCRPAENPREDPDRGPVVHDVEMAEARVTFRNTFELRRYSGDAFI